MWRDERLRTPSGVADSRSSKRRLAAQTTLDHLRTVKAVATSFWPRRLASAAVRLTAIAGFPLDASGCVLKFPGLLDQVFELLPLCVIRHVGAYFGRNHVSVKKGAFCQGHDMGGQEDGGGVFPVADQCENFQRYEPRRA